MVTKIIELEKPKLKNPIFVEGLPGIGNVGRIACGYLIEELKAKKFAELYSSHFMPFVLLQ
ncbi:MAG: PAC2 family protein, partial [Candidatus Aenigmatarchaeota archaeon]